MNPAEVRIVNKFTYLQEEKLFFRAAFKNDDQNCLRDHDFQLITAFYTDQIESRTGKKISPHLQFQLERYFLFCTLYNYCFTSVISKLRAVQTQCIITRFPPFLFCIKVVICHTPFVCICHHFDSFLFFYLV